MRHLDSNKLNIIAKQYLHLSIGDKRVEIPYVIHPNQFAFNKTSGKGKIVELEKELLTSLKRKGLDITTLSEIEIKRLMRKEKIGLECSGLIYNIFDDYCLQTGHGGVTNCFNRYPGARGMLDRKLLGFKRVRRISADTLTNDLNTVKIDTVENARVGDLIRLSPSKWKGKHVALILEKSDKELTYIHSSCDTRKNGVHLGKIKILDIGKDLDSQLWEEVTKRGENYGKIAYLPLKGDSIRRIKCLI